MRKLFQIVGLLILSVVLSGCVTENKAVGLSSATDGLAARATANPAGGALPFLPEAIWTQTCFSYASSPFAVASEKMTCARIFTMAKKKSFLGSLFGIDDSAESMSYIGSPNDTAEQTVAILNAAKSVASVAPK